MKNLLRTTALLLIFNCSFLITKAQCVPVDFSTWHKAGQPNAGNWVVSNGDSMATETFNGDPTFFISPFDLMNVHLSCNFKTSSFDDDYMGFVFSYKDPIDSSDSFNCWLYDWKQHQQSTAKSGMSLNRLNGVIPNVKYDSVFWSHYNTTVSTVVQNNFGSVGWLNNYDHRFELYLTYTRATILIDNAPVFDVQDNFQPGRFGFYNYSQDATVYSNLQYEMLVDFTFPSQGKCRGDTASFQFLDTTQSTDLHQYQKIVWDFGDGDSAVVNTANLLNLNPTHSYQTAGLYNLTLTVLGFTGCTYSTSHQVDVRNPISLTPSLAPPLCIGSNSGHVSAIPSGGFGSYAYSWNNGADTLQTWTGRPAGSYSVLVTDGRCSATASYSLSDLPQQTICIVTVDSNSTHNIIIWEKTDLPPADSFFIYREISTNNYQRIGAVHRDSLSEFHDFGANPNVTAYRYKISTRDTCFDGTALSPYHNSIHLQYFGAGNLIWNVYEIENDTTPVSSFDVYCDTLANGNWQLILHAPGNQYTASDVNYYLHPNALYRIVANCGYACTAARSSSSSVFSNIVAIVGTGIDWMEAIHTMDLYPNPATESVRITIDETMLGSNLTITDITGREVLHSAVQIRNPQFDIRNLSQGVYFISLENKTGRVTKKLVKQ